MGPIQRISALVMVVLLGFPLLSYGALESNATLQPLVAALHVHSTVSTGTLTLDQLAERAERFGLDAVILSENFVLRYEYGLYPFRGVIRRAVTYPSVMDYGIHQFLTDVATTQARHPKVLLIPGVEVAPHYFWTGSLLTHNLTMHNSQKNLLVLGLSRTEDYEALPVQGNPQSYQFEWTTVLNLTPVLLFIPAGWLWRRRINRRPTRRNTSANPRRALAVVLATVALLLLLNAWPFSQPVFSAYAERLGYRPYQTVIDTVAARGGIAIWSMPEARDLNTYPFGPLGTVTVNTEPYAEALVLTSGYTGFGGVYQEGHTADRPGGIWDQVIDQYVTGQRMIPPFVFGEIAFHKPGEAGMELNQVLNVLWVRERTPAGIIEALRTGQLYPVAQYKKEFGLRLDAFQVECDGGKRVARSGETLDRKGTQDLTVHMAVSATDAGAHPISLTVIRSGRVLTRLSGVTPFQYRLVDDSTSLEARTFYRVEIQGGGEILSNPIFVEQGSSR